MDTDPEVTGPMNLGNPHKSTIRELAEKVIAKTGSGSELVYRNLPQDDPKQRKPDITKAKTLLDWQPFVNLDDGLERTIDFFRARLPEFTKLA